MAEHVIPGLPFRVILTKVEIYIYIGLCPSRYFDKMLIFVLVPRDLSMGGAQRDSILIPLWKIAHRLYRGLQCNLFL